MEKLEKFIDVYKLNKGDNVLLLFVRYHEDELDGYYEPSLDICIETMNKITPKLEKMGVNYICALNVFSNVSYFTVEQLTQMRDFLNDEIERKSNE